MNPFVSVILPTYEYGGKANVLLDQCLGSIASQSYKDIEVIVIDHSMDNGIERYLKKWNLPIRYKKNARGRGNSSVNMNDGIELANGRFIKILHMDDWLCDPRAIEKMALKLRLNPDCSWGAFGFNHYYENTEITDRYIRPHINAELQALIGCPSVSFFVNNKNEPDRFDESFIIINDSDMHFRLGRKYGDPLLIEDCCVTIRVHDMQVSKIVANTRHIDEIIQYHRKNLQDVGMDELTRLANHYASDKGTQSPPSGHHGPRLHFTPVYEKHFNEIRNHPIKIFEIGVGGGASLKMWFDYFPRAQIFAIDTVPQSQHDNERIKTFVCDQSDRVGLESILTKIGPLDIIIDDGSHVVMHQQISLGCLFPHLNSGGQYWIEDLHTSDRSVWAGKILYGYDMSFAPGESTVELLEDYISQRRFDSAFLTRKENQLLDRIVADVQIFDLPATSWGLNKLALLVRS